MNESAAFAAGCFWGVEAAFQKLKGVVSTVVGYMGGHLNDPTYEEVCTDKTGHAETVRIEFDPAKISYEEVVRYFFKIHDPTTQNRQGPDIGSQYRSVIFFYTQEQHKIAQRCKAEYQEAVTEIVPAGPFYKAEEYHQRYHEKHGGSCQL